MKLQKPALKAAAAQMKAKVERKPVASEKTVKEVRGTRGRPPYRR